MVGFDASVHVSLLAGSSLVTAGLGTHAWRRRDDHGARPFAFMMAAATVWSACYAVALTQTGGARLFWERTQWFGIATIPVFFFLFAMEYTGRDRFTTRRAVAALSVVPAVTLLLVWTNPAHGLIWRSYAFTETGGITVIEQWFGGWYWVNLLFAYGLVVAGSIALLRLVVVSEYLYTDQRDRVVGHTVLLYDVTERERRERELRAQRDRLKRLERINTVIRDVNQALIDAATVEEAERTVAETLVAPGEYETAWVSTSLSDGPPVGMTAGDDGAHTAPEKLLPEALGPPDATATESPSHNVCCSCLPVIATPGGGEHR
ncbi:MAG: histidine kinase N-terminal 7TM domain-containing protein [Halobacteriales archaeon]